MPEKEPKPKDAPRRDAPRQDISRQDSRRDAPRQDPHQDVDDLIFSPDSDRPTVSQR